MIKNKSIHAENLLSRAFLFLVAGTAFAVIVTGFIIRDFRFIVPFIVILGNVSLGSFVYLRGRANRINISFCLICYFAAAWAFTIFMYSAATTASSALLWSRLAASSSAMFPALFLYFTSLFPKEERVPSSIQIITWAAIAIIFSLLSFTDVIVSGVAVGPSGFVFSPGVGLVFFLVYFVGFFGYSFYQLVKKHYEYSGINRMQIRYVLLGFFLAVTFSTATNILLPLLGVAEFSGYGPLSTIIAIAFVTYAIVKHRLMSIELVIQRGVIYGLVTGFIIAMYALAILLSERLFQEAVGYSSFVITAVAAVIIAILYQPIIKWLQDVTNRIFFRGHYDYQKTLRQVSSAIASIIRIDQLTKLIVSTFTDTMKVSELSFLLYDKARRRYRSASVELKGASRYRRMEIDEGSPIIKYLRDGKEMLLRDEIEGRLQKAKSDDERRFLNDLKDELERIGISLWVPIVLKDELIGVIASGNKLSGEIFTSEDIALLYTLSNQTAVALDNARLYEEILSMKTYSEDILKSMTNGVLTTDLKGRVITFNEKAEKISGFARQEVVGGSVTDIWHDGVISNAVEGTLRGGAYSNWEANLVNKEGNVIPISISTTLLRDGSGKNIGVLAVITDLSEVKELEDKVRQADKLAALGTMAAGMAHEIKNPLSSMKVLTQLMPKKFDDPSFRSRFTEIMPREISRIDRIVESLLGFARATAPKFEPIKIESLIGEALGFYVDDIEKRNIKLIRNFSPVPDIVADSGQLIQVFSNLILNAIQAMSQGGELEISIREGERGEGIPDTIKVLVRDTGHGIPSGYLQKLFDPFFTTKHGGTGLGLTIAHSIVDGHRGSIDVNSETGVGTTFTVTLPVSQ